MTLQNRLIAAVMLLTVLTLGGAFFTIALTVNRAQERQLDEALVLEAREEAREVAAVGGEQLTISDRPGPAANDVGPLTKYGALYGRDGAVRAFTPSWRRGPPARASIAHGRATPFDLRVEGEHLRAVLEAVPGRPELTLLLAAPRTDLDGDAYFLRRALTMVFAVACAWTLAVASWFARRLTRDHQRITEVAHRVAGGDLSARVAQASADAEVSQLGRDLDETIARFATVVDAQRRFIANAAHELRSPLTTLLGEVTFVLRRDREASEYRDALREVLSSAERLHELTEDLLALARLGSTKGVEPADVAVDDVVAGAIDDVSAAARARKITVVYVRGGGRVRGYANDLRRLVRNLLENAVRHSPEGGEVRVHTLPEDEAVTLVVDDEGEGVAPDERTRIFEPFFRGARARASEDGGAGLGLTIAREIAREHHGDLRCEAGPGGRGARFVARLRAPP